MTVIRVVDHASAPGGRYKSDGPFSGEWFREDVLKPALTRALDTNDVVTVELDGTAGYGASFLEEAFGGLIRTGAFRPDQLLRVLKVVARTPLFAPYQALAERYIENSRRQPVA
jgi:hypothetical protein